MTPLLPHPVPLDPPPGDPHALADLVARLDAAAALLGALGEEVCGDPAVAASWTGQDANATVARVERVGALACDAAAELLRASARVALHRELVVHARRRLARLREAQEDDFCAVALRMGCVVAWASPSSGSDSAAAIEELETAEAARRAVRAALTDEVADDAAATAAVLAACSAVAGGSGRADDEARVVRHLADVLPGWHERALEQRGRDFAAALLGGGDAFGREAAARELLPWAGNGAIAAGVLTGLGAQGFRDVLRQLGDGSLSADSALARAMAAVLGAPVPLADAGEVARVRDGRHVGTDYRSLDGDLVAFGMGVVLAAGRGNRRAGPPAATVREWGRQIIARERALGSERIVDRVRLPVAYAQPGDPLDEVLVRLAETEDPVPAAVLLRAQPTWTHLLARPWDDDGAAFAALVERAGVESGGDGDVAVRSGLRALATGLGDDGDPADWTVDRATAAVVAPFLAEAVAARADVVVEPLTKAAAGEGRQTSQLLRGLGYLSSHPAATVALDRGLAEAVTRLTGVPGTGDLADPAKAVPVAAGYVAVQEYGQRLAHALDEYAAQEQAERRMHVTDVIKEALSLAPVAGAVLRPVMGLGAVVGDLDGTWEASPDIGRHFPIGEAVRAAGGDLEAATAYRYVAATLGAPTAPVSPPIDWMGLAADLMPGGGRLRDALELGGEGLQDLLEELPAPFG